MEEKILAYLKHNSKKINKAELRKKINVSGEEELAFFDKILEKLEEEGQIYLDKNGYYMYFDPKRLEKVVGTLKINKTGNGYIFIQKGSKKEKYIIDKKDLNGALNGDTVILENIGHLKNNQFKAQVEKIIKRSLNPVVFELAEDQTFIPFEPTNIKVTCPKEMLKQIVAGSRVLIFPQKEIIAVFQNTPYFEGKILKVIGHKDDPQIDIKTVAGTHNFFLEFPEDVKKQLEEISTEVTEEEIKERVDLREEKVFTIDGKDTKDIDDAISIKKEGENYILSVHIADVSHYVKEGTPLFEEALKRGTSAYLADSVIPMLPHELSNGICSLNPNEDRLAKTVVMTINPNGKVINYEIFDSVIKSRKKMNYDDVNKILEEGITPEGYEDFVIELNLAQKLSQILTEKRKEEGSLEFATDEIKVYTENGIPKVFKSRKQKTGEKIIENFMITANQTITENYAYMGYDFLFRVHGKPTEERLITALKELSMQGLCTPAKVGSLINKIINGKLTNKDLENFMQSYIDDENYQIISQTILKSMQKAIYSPKNEGHYGLALTHYTHFTSPIRRFPDLMVHTIMNYYQTYDTERLKQIEKRLPEICDHSSHTEREADKAEAEVLELKMAEYMLPNIGNTYTGKVMNVNPYGMAITLDNNVRVISDTEDIIQRKDRPKIKIGSKVYVLIKDVSIPFRAVYAKISNAPFEKPKQKILK